MICESFTILMTYNLIQFLYFKIRFNIYNKILNNKKRIKFIIFIYNNFSTTTILIISYTIIPYYLYFSGFMNPYFFFLPCFIECNL